MIPALSTLNSTRPALTSLIARSRSKVIVPDLGLGIRPAPAKDAAKPADDAHHVRRRECDVELEPAGLDALGDVVAAHLVGPGAQCLLGLLALGEGEDADLLAGAVREDDRAADHLVGVARVDAEADVGLCRGVEADVGRLLEQVHRLGRAVRPVPIYECRCLLILLAVIQASDCSPLLTAPITKPPLSAAGCAFHHVRWTWGVLLADDLDAHRARRALDDLRGALDVDGVEIGHLDSRRSRGSGCA